MELALLTRYARGDQPSELLLKNARVVNVLSGEIIPTNVAIAHSRIIGLGNYEAEREIDLEGAYLAPGFIDAHVHVESAMVPPAEFARVVAPLGATTIITDPHEIANVLGLEGIRFMFDSAKYGPLSMFVMVSSCIPATRMETNGAELHWYDLAPLQSDPWVLGLAEVMNFPGVVAGEPEVLDKLRTFKGAVIDGHAPGLSGKALQAYVAAGIQSDHECTTVEEAQEKLRLGMTIFLREATNARNLKALLPLVTPFNRDRICFCTDDRQPADLLDEGSYRLHGAHSHRRRVGSYHGPAHGDVESCQLLSITRPGSDHARPSRRPHRLRRSASAAPASGLPRRRPGRQRWSHGTSAASAQRPQPAPHYERRLGTRGSAHPCRRRHCPRDRHHPRPIGDRSLA